MVSSWKVVATTVEYCGVGLEFGALVPHLDHDHHVLRTYFCLTTSSISMRK